MLNPLIDRQGGLLPDGECEALKRAFCHGETPHEETDLRVGQGASLVRLIFDLLFSKRS